MVAKNNYLRQRFCHRITTYFSCKAKLLSTPIALKAKSPPFEMDGKRAFNNLEKEIERKISQKKYSMLK